MEEERGKEAKRFLLLCFVGQWYGRRQVFPEYPVGGFWLLQNEWGAVDWQ